MVIFLLSRDFPGYGERYLFFISVCHFLVGGRSLQMSLPFLKV